MDFTTLLQVNDSDKRLKEWRARALDVFLTVAAVFSFPAALIPIGNAFVNPDEIPGAIAITIVFLLLLLLAIFQKMNPHLRGWILILVGYATAVIGIARTNLAGDMGFYLLIMPLLAFILIDARSGFAAGLLSLFIYWGGAILTERGVFDATIVNTADPFSIRWWVDAGLVFVLLLVTILILFWQFFLLMQKTAAAEIEAASELAQTIEKLEQANLRLLEAKDDLEQKVEERTASLRESERRLMDIINFLPDATVVIDDKNRVVAWNRVMERITGVPAEKMLGKGNYEYATPFYAERRPVLIDLVSKPNEEIEKRYTSIKRDGLTITGEAYVPNLKDRPAYIFSTASMLRDEKGNYAGAIETVRDITDRKQAEEELKKARDAANAASQAKSTFLASMSHEIRTPLNGIIGMTGLLLDTPLTPEQHEFAETIRNSGDALLTIINDILDFSKIEAGKMEIERHPFHLRDCLESAMDLIALRASEKGLELGLLIEPDVPATIMGDVTRLRQVIVNLLSNAIKFTEIGEIVIEAKVEVSDGDRYRLHFMARDTGIGIPPDRLDGIFDSFSQVDASTTRKYGGTGLGLAISKRLVELMGGSMWVESELGRGSTFHFTIKTSAAVIDQPDDAAPSLSLENKRMLIVDDNETNRRILELQAKSWRMKPFVFGSPREALQAVKDGQTFDIAVLDMHMPEMDGARLAHEIRAAGNSAPLIMLTSLGWREAVDISIFSSFLTKPIKQSNLFNAIVGALSTKDSEPVKIASSSSIFDSTLAERIPLRILLAEDNAVNQKLALKMLERMGYRADVAANGLEVLESVKRQKYDLVFMDVQMPEMDGLQATRIIRSKMPPDRQPHIVAMTANAMQGDRDECIAAGMNDYVSKPIQVKDLQAALERTLK